MVERVQEELDARVKVSKAVDYVGTTIGMIRAILGRGPYEGCKVNAYHLPVNSGFDIILEGITALKKEYGYLNSVFESIAPFYPESNRKNINVKLTATHAAIEALQEYEAILSNIKTSLNELPMRFFD